MSDRTDDLVIAVGTDLSAAGRGLKKLMADVGATTNTIQKQFDNVGRGIDKSMSTALQSRIDAMVGIGAKGAKEWTGALADQGKELERLRAKYSPLFATINNYKSAVADIRRAHGAGAISADEMAAAIQRERQAALASTAAIKGRNAALADTPVARGGQGFQTANIAAQFQDIAVTSAMGMSPLQIALQQGTQLSSVFATMGNGKQVVSGLAAAFTSLISPMSLVTIGLIAGGAAAIQYFGSLGSESKTADDAIKSHADTIASIKDAYGVAAEGLGDYIKKSQAEAAAAARENLKVQQDVAKAATSEFNKLLGVLQARTGGASDVATRFKPFTDAIREFRKSVADGSPDFVRLRNNIEAIVATNPEGLRKLADEIINGSTAAADADRRVRSAKDVIDGLGKIAAEQTGGVASLTSALNDLASIAVPALTDAERALDAYRKAVEAAQGAEERRAAAKAYDDARQRIADANPTVVNPDGRTVAVPIPGQKPTQLGDEPNKKAESAAQKAANAYRDLIKSADDRIARMRLELDLTDQYGAATDAARFRLQLLQDAQDKGRKVSDAQRAEIEEKVQLFGKLSEALAQAKLQQDLLNNARFSSLSNRDQQVITTLRQYGLPEDLGSRQASMIRQSLESDEIKEGVSSFLGDFKSALLENGGDIGEAFGDALLNALMNSMNKQWESIFDLIGSGIASMKGGGQAGAAGGGIASVASAGSAGVGSAVDLASGLFGASESKNGGSINAFLKKGGVNIDAARTAWCAGFVNSSLEQVGVKGSGSLTANSFQNWGSKVNPSDVMRGDVLLQSRGLGAGQAGGHVGFATGASRMGAGGLQLQMLSGNSGNAVTTEWVSALELQARRATEAASSLATVGNTAQQATQGIGQFGSVLSGAGQGGGGGFSWLTSLFGGGVSPTSPSWKPNTTFGNFLAGVPGFASGTASAPRGVALVGEKGPELVRFRGGEEVVPNHRLRMPKAPRLSGRSGAQTIRNETALTVQIQGASGDDHVRLLVRQGVEAGLHAARENDRRGGFGEIQTRYTSQRG